MRMFAFLLFCDLYFVMTVYRYRYLSLRFFIFAQQRNNIDTVELQNRGTGKLSSLRRKRERERARERARERERERRIIICNKNNM